MQDLISVQAGVPDIIREMAQATSKVILPYFRRPTNIENKLVSQGDSGAAGFDPVTEADKGAEAVLRQLINQKFPHHGILGEEYGAENLDAEYVWVLDPIDGTRAFISGLPVWGTLIALCKNGVPILGAMIQPYLNEIFVGGGGHAILSTVDGSKSDTVLRTRPVTDISQATIFTTDAKLFEGWEREAYDKIEAQCRLNRYGLDCYGYAMVAAGMGDFNIEAGLQIYDIAALVPLIESAGGIVTNWDGTSVEGLLKRERMRVVASGNKELHQYVLEQLKG
ncbi:MAG: histidinol-phosphatase [Hyphomicrobiales bacterium]|nr:MAG: histidinol-phosphatase [Hyphomicrobiales bacterium]